MAGIRASDSASKVMTGLGELGALALRVLLPGLSAGSLDRVYAELYREGLAGACLFGLQQASPAGVASWTTQLLDANAAAVVAIDEEGGDVTRLHAREGSPVLGAAALGAIDDPVVTSRAAATLSRELVELRIGLVLGPVADIQTNPLNPVIGTRSFGADPVLVSRHVSAWISGASSEGLACCAKHFPGHGDTSEDSHTALPISEVPAELLAQRELRPFRSAVRAEVAAVMTAHIVVPSLDPAHPATFSRVSMDRLRSDLGFRGAIITDALDMIGASGTSGIDVAAVRALAAGADLLCLGPGTSADSIRHLQAQIVSAVRAGQLAEQRLAEAAEAVASLSRRIHHPSRGGEPCRVLSAEEMLKVAARSISVSGPPLPCLENALVVSIDALGSEVLGEAQWGLTPDVILQERAESGLSSIDRGRPVVLQIRDQGPESTAMIWQLAECHQIVLVDWGMAGQRPWPVPTITTHGMSAPAVTVVQQLLAKAGLQRAR